MLPKLKGTAIGAFPLQEIAGNFYGARAAGARLDHRDPQQPFTGRFKRVPAPGRGSEGLGGGASGLALALETQLLLWFRASTPAYSTRQKCCNRLSCFVYHSMIAFNTMICTPSSPPSSSLLLFVTMFSCGGSSGWCYWSCSKTSQKRGTFFTREAKPFPGWMRTYTDNILISLHPQLLNDKVKTEFLCGTWTLASTRSGRSEEFPPELRDIWRRPQNCVGCSVFSQREAGQTWENLCWSTKKNIRSSQNHPRGFRWGKNLNTVVKATFDLLLKKPRESPGWQKHGEHPHSTFALLADFE